MKEAKFDPGMFKDIRERAHHLKVLRSIDVNKLRELLFTSNAHFPLKAQKGVVLGPDDSVFADFNTSDDNEGKSRARTRARLIEAVMNDLSYLLDMAEKWQKYMDLVQKEHERIEAHMRSLQEERDNRDY